MTPFRHQQSHPRRTPSQPPLRGPPLRSGPLRSPRPPPPPLSLRPRQPQRMAAAASTRPPPSTPRRGEDHSARLRFAPAHSDVRITPPHALPPRPFRACGSEVRRPASNRHHRRPCPVRRRFGGGAPVALAVFRSASTHRPEGRRARFGREPPLGHSAARKPASILPLRSMPHPRQSRGCAPPDAARAEARHARFVSR
jgi:hypothetical protein